MREVYTSPDFTQVGFYKSILDEAGIASFIRNENGNTQDYLGPLIAPCLCIIEDGDYERALRILKARQAEPSVPALDWTCAACSEVNPGNFETCWHCGAVRPVRGRTEVG